MGDVGATLIRNPLNLPFREHPSAGFAAERPCVFFETLRGDINTSGITGTSLLLHVR